MSSLTDQQSRYLPLYAKILFWFFMNLALLGVFAYYMITGLFGLNLEEIQRGVVATPMRTVADVIGRDLNTHPPEQWDHVLEKYRDSCELTFTLFGPNDRHIAGTKAIIPDELKASIEAFEQSVEGETQQQILAYAPLFTEVKGEFPGVWLAIPIFVKPQVGKEDKMLQYLIVRSAKISENPLLNDTRPWVWTAVGCVVLSFLFWIPLVRNITHAIQNIKDATGRIADGEFGIVVDEKRSDELGMLGASVNRMAKKIENYVKHQKKFLGDIAHELCSPLARTQMALGSLEVRTPPQNRHYLEDITEDLQSMSKLVDELMDFSKASYQERQGEQEQVLLARLVEQVVQKETEGNDARINIKIAPELTAYARANMLERALANVLRNAIRYAREHGEIDVQATHKAEYIVLEVLDQGKGVPEDSLPQLFDPLFRLDASRSRDSGGNGLGLAIVKSCIEACNGTVRAFNRPTGGLTIRITLHAH